ncbi:TolC family protein [Leeuwenhoekiella palythoae]|uniref:TolC family protein n=1 Tax=Leeuwenhoekiella palythoae TaxID=573501 RepID=UPI001CE18B22|nr:TolC family protein [Leeuwenhoekiella palythoae]UBZ09255.1 TolC family protein [Leeuwenhoekiella palythoae]
MKKYLIILIVLFPLLSKAQEKLEAIQQKLTETDPDQVTWSLQDCIDYAALNNLTVLDAQLDASSAAVNYKQSKQQRLPNLTGSASESYSRGYSIDPITSNYVNQDIFSTSTSLNTSITLFQGSQLNNQIDQNALLLDQSALFIEEAKNNITLSLTEAYLQALYYKEAIAVAKNTLAGSQQESKIAKSRYDAGAIAKKDYSDALSQEASNNYELIQAQNSYEAQLLLLRQLLELEPETTFDIVDPDIDYNGSTLLLDKVDVYHNALNTLPEIAASKLDIDISEKDLEIAKGAYLPTLSLTGSLGSGYTSIQDMSFTDQFDINFNQRLGLSLSVPIFNRGQTKANVQNAKINIEKANIALRTQEKELYNKVETAWRNARSSQEQLLAAEAARNAAKDSYELAQKQYEVGAINTTDLVLTQNTYSNAEQNYIQAKYLGILYAQLLQFYQGNEIKL